MLKLIGEMLHSLGYKLGYVYGYIKGAIGALSDTFKK